VVLAWDLARTTPHDNRVYLGARGARGDRARRAEGVAEMWQDAQPGTFLLDDYECVLAVQRHIVANDKRQPLSVPRFPWYY
jgi:hypothetical protein